MNHIATIKGNVLLLNGIALFTALGLYVVVLGGFWNIQRPVEQPGLFSLIILLVGIMVLHEGIHGAVASLFVDRRRIRFQARWLVLICKVDGLMTRNQFLFYSVAPAALLGLLGIVLYYCLASPENRFLAALLFLGGVSSGGGDFWFTFQLLKHPSDRFVLDKGVEVEVLGREQ
jgi:hypothetical protein